MSSYSLVRTPMIGLQKIVGFAAESDREVIILGCDPDDVGMHSCRKGTKAYSLGQMASPITVVLRMGQSLGKVKDAYLFQCKGGDQLC